MPTVQVQIIAGRSDDQKQKVAQAITDALKEHMGAPPEATYVIFDDVPATDWMIGGQSVAARRKGKGG